MSQKISGRLAYAGVSRNGKIYLPEALVNGDAVTIPILLNHGDIVGAENIDESMLPKSYKDRLLNNEEIVLGSVKLRFDYDSAELFYSGTVTDPFYSQKSVLEKMFVSQGITYLDGTQQKLCTKLQCFEIITNAVYREMSLVFKPGLPLVSEIATERFQDTSHNQLLEQKINMDTTNPTDDKKLHENASDAPSDKPVSSQEQCPEGQAYNNDTGKCEPIDTAQNSNPTTNEPPAQVKKSTEADGDNEECDDCPEKKKQAEEKKAVEGSPNADIKSEKEYLQSRLKAIAKMENSEGELKALEHQLKKLDLQEKIRVAEEKLSGKALTGTTTTKAAESAKNPSSDKQNIIADEAAPEMISWIKQVIAKENVNPSFVQKISKEAMLQKYLYHDVKDYSGQVIAREKVYPDGAKKATEGINPAPDLGRITSNQVFVLPNGKIVTPARQFCEVVTLNPGETEAFFYDIGDVTFADYVDGTKLDEQAVNVRSIGGEPD